MRSNDGRTLVLALLVLSTSALASPASAAVVRPIRFEHLSLEEGLSQAAVMDVLQDRRGYIWLATEDGLNRYDGTAFRVYRHDAADPDTLPDNFIWDMEQDGSGSVWIATRGGLCRWDRATDRFVRQDTSGVRNIRVLRYQARGNVLWIGTRDSGLLRLDIASGRLDRFRHDPADAGSLVDDKVYALYVDGKDRLWVGTESGLDLRNNGAEGFTHYGPAAPDGSSSYAKVRAILADDMGALWIGTSGGGLNRLDLASGQSQPFRHDPAVATSLANDDVRALLQDSGGRLWVGTSGGVDLYDPEREAFAHYRQDPRNPNSLSDDHVLSLAQDRGGVLWVGTRMGGVHKWNPLSWQFGHVAPDPENPNGLGGGKVTALAEDRAGALWIGTYGAGLYQMERSSGDMKAYRHDDRNPRSLPSDTVTALRHDYRGDLWIGTLDSGLVRMSRATGAFKSYPYDATKSEGLSARGVTSILEDGDRRLWLGTYGGGLERFEPETGRFTHFRHDAKDDSSLSGDRVAAIAEVGDGRLWVGTMETGLNLFDPRTGRAERFNQRAGDPASLPSDAVHALHLDVAGALWVGTHSGLSELQPDGRTFKTYTTRNGLPSDVIYAIANDRHGRLWLSTNSGLSAFDPRSDRFLNYGVSNGLQAREFNFGAWYQSTTGELFFGGLNGFNAFVPDRIRQLAQAPEVVLTGVNVDHRPVGGGPADETRGIRLGFRDKVLGLEFAALDFTAPERNQFSYKLEGFDPEWVPLTGKKSVTYTNLNPGRYTFHLRGANSDGRWNDKGVSVPVNVAAPPWATAPAFTGYSLFLIGAVFGVTRSQKRKFAREADYARVLEFRVQERTRELSERQVDLEKANDELARASITDSLTGLANRRFLTEYIEKEVALLHRRYNRLSDGPITADLLDLAFVMIDVDHFKTINDSAGHAAGDNVLRQLRDLLVACSRTSDIIVRWGGDEFLLVARDLSGDGLLELAERVRARVAQHVFDIGEGRVVRTTCSIGLACYPFFREQLDALSWEQVISVADRALYVAKASGRNAWVGFQPGITSLPIQGLFSAISHGAQQLVREGTLRVVSSLTGVRNLVWETAEQEKAANG